MKNETRGGERVCDILFFQVETKMESAWGSRECRRSVINYSFKVQWKMKSAGGWVAGGSWVCDILFFQSEVKNEIHEDFAGLWQIIFSKWNKKRNPRGVAGLMNFEKYFLWNPRGVRGVGSRGMVQNWNFLVVWKTRQWTMLQLS